MELSVYNMRDEDMGRKIALESFVFGIEPNDHAICSTVKQYRANQRRGTYKVKERGEMSGPTRKLLRQKGTGGARRSDINSNILRGGVHAFGPRPRSYSFRFNRKLRQLARRNVLTYKAQGSQIMTLDQFSFGAPKTKSFVGMTKTLNVDGQKTPYVVSQIEDTVALNARSILGVSIMRARDLDTYCVLDYRKVVFTEDAPAQVNEMFQAGTQQQSIDMGIIIKPITSEKVITVTESNQQRYAFLVTPAVNRTKIRNAAEKMYSVKIDSVNTCRYDGGCSGHYTKSGVITGYKPAFKKILITLQGESIIDFFSNT